MLMLPVSKISVFQGTLQYVNIGAQILIFLGIQDCQQIIPISSLLKVKMKQYSTCACTTFYIVDLVSDYTTVRSFSPFSWSTITRAFFLICIRLIPIKVHKIDTSNRGIELIIIIESKSEYLQ